MTLLSHGSEKTRKFAVVAKRVVRLDADLEHSPLEQLLIF